MANTNLKIYLTHNQMIMTNNQGFWFEFNIPTPGNVVVVHVGPEAFHIGLTPPEAPTSPSPNVSPYDPDNSSSLSTPSDDGEGPPPNQNYCRQHSYVNNVIRVATPASAYPGKLLHIIVTYDID